MSGGVDKNHNSPGGSTTQTYKGDGLGNGFKLLAVHASIFFVVVDDEWLGTGLY